MATQQSAVTGRRTRSPLRSIISAQAPFSRELARIEDEKLLRDEELDLVRKRILSDEEQAAEARKISTASTIVSGGLGLAQLAPEGLLGGIASGVGQALGFTEVAAATAPTLVEAAALAETATATGIGTTIGKALPGLAVATGLQLARPNIEEFTEEQVGTSAVPVANIAGRAGQGAAIGGTIGGPAGAAAGAIIGGAIGVSEETFGWMDEQLGTTAATVLNPVGALTGWLDDQGVCIIITACTDRDSPEVEIAREYRDIFMTPQQLRGYYMIAERFVPTLKRRSTIKDWVKRRIVDRWIEFAKWSLGMTNDKPSFLSSVLSLGFLSLCNRVGQQRFSYMRLNGEVF